MKRFLLKGLQHRQKTDNPKVEISAYHFQITKLYLFFFRVIDVGSEWRTFSNEKNGVDPSRVGGPENPLLNGSDLSTMIGPGRGDASFDDFGISKYQNRRTVSSQIRRVVLILIICIFFFFTLIILVLDE